MGHVHLGRLPKSRRWQDVVRLLGQGADDARVNAESAHAAEKDLLGAVGDPVFIEALLLLAAIPEAARGDGFAAALGRAGVEVTGPPELLDLVAAAGARLDRVARRGGRCSDLGELARRALLGTLSDAIGAGLPGLIEVTPGDVQAAARRLATPQGFPVLTRMFFGRLLRDSLASWLDRTLAREVGPGRRFAEPGALQSFEAALSRHVHETTRIVKEFSAGWHARHVRDQGVPDRDRVAGFGAIAVRKIVEELQARRDPDA